jgi:hypothetical protein
MLPTRKALDGADLSAVSVRPLERVWLRADAASVHFDDHRHVRWTVIERDARRDPGARGEWCLIFMCTDAVRRVWTYPSGWRDLAPAALLALSWGR